MEVKLVKMYDYGPGAEKHTYYQVWDGRGALVSWGVDRTVAIHRAKQQGFRIDDDVAYVLAFRRSTSATFPRRSLEDVPWRS